EAESRKAEQLHRPGRGLGNGRRTAAGGRDVDDQGGKVRRIIPGEVHHELVGFAGVKLQSQMRTECGGKEIGGRAWVDGDAYDVLIGEYEIERIVGIRARRARVRAADTERDPGISRHRVRQVVRQHRIVINRYLCVCEPEPRVCELIVWLRRVE